MIIKTLFFKMDPIRPLITYVNGKSQKLRKYDSDDIVLVWKFETLNRSDFLVRCHLIKGRTNHLFAVQNENFCTAIDILTRKLDQKLRKEKTWGSLRYSVSRHLNSEIDSEKIPARMA